MFRYRAQVKACSKTQNMTDNNIYGQLIHMIIWLTRLVNEDYRKVCLKIIFEIYAILETAASMQLQRVFVVLLLILLLSVSQFTIKAPFATTCIYKIWIINPHKVQYYLYKCIVSGAMLVEYQLCLVSAKSLMESPFLREPP